MKEKLSAWMDDELNRFEERSLVERLQADDELRGCWERYHLAREAIRHELESVAPPTLAGRVSSAIRQQAPVRRRRRLVRMAGTAAIAASVAVIALVGLQLMSGRNGPVAPATTVAGAPGAPVKTASSPWKNRQPDQARSLNVFLVEHNEFSSTNSVSGMLPYVRIVSHGDDNR